MDTHSPDFKLNRQQERAARHLDGPALVIAGPGSGKTTVIMARLDFLMRMNGVPPERILSLTFNKAAAEEMSVRCGRIFGDELRRRARFSTIHSFCWAALRERGVRVKLLEDAGNGGAREVLRALHLRVTGRKAGEDDINAVAGLIGLVKNTMRPPADAAAEAGMPDFAKIYEAYERHKSDAGLIDYDDMLIETLRLFRADAAFLAKMRRGISYLQVDEGQDLSKVQTELMRLVAGDGGNIFMVADDDQSIYSFRGAEPDNLKKFGQLFPGAVLYFLEQNFRSTASIVKASSGFIKTNKTRFDKAYYTYNAPGTPPAVVDAGDGAGQAAAAARIAMSFAERGSVGILYRNNISAISLTYGLDRAGADFCLHEAETGLLSHWIFADMREILLPAQAGEAAKRNDARLAGALAYDEICDSKHAKTASEAATVLAKVRRLAGTATPSEALEHIFTRTGYFGYCRRLCRKFGHTASHAARAFDTLRMLADGSRRPQELFERLEYLNKIMYNKAQTSREAAITLSTIHASKGLEYDCVILADVFDGEFPGRKSIEQLALHGASGPMEEERRLFYVGMTRARRNLYILSPGGKSQFAGAVKNLI